MNENQPAPQVPLARRYHQELPWTDVTAVEASLRINACFRAQHSAIARCFGMLGTDATFPRYTVLRILFFAKDQPVSQNDIRIATNATSPNVTYLVDGLEKEGLVTRIPDPTDRRVTFVQLTPAGRELAAKLVPAMAEVMGHMLDGFTDEEKDTFNRLLARFNANADASYIVE